MRSNFKSNGAVTAGKEPMRRVAAIAVVLGTACASGETEAPPVQQQPRPALPEPPRSVPPPAAMTPDELAETRRKAGFKDSTELAAERAAAREQVARAYVRTQLSTYRAVLKTLRGSVDEIDRAARRWLRAGDPQRAYERWRGGFRRRAERVSTAYDRLHADGIDGGRAQALLAQAYQQWAELKEDLSGEVAADQRFAGLLGDLRDSLDAVAQVLDEIESDEDLASPEN